MKPLRWGTDAAAVLALMALVCLSFTGLYGGGWVWVAGMGGAVLGVGIGLVGAWRSWPVWLLAAAGAGSYLVAGSALAMPQWARSGFVPTGQTLQGLVLGVVQVWRRVLTIDAPIGATDNLLVLPLVTTLIASIVAISISTRSSRPALGWIPAAVALMVSISFGVQTAPLAVPVGLGSALIMVIWTSYRRAEQRALLAPTGGSLLSSATLRTLGSGAAVLVVAGLVASLLASVVAPDHRRVLRDVVEPPLDVRQWPSPLQQFRANVSEHSDDVLFTVLGLPEGAGVRLATLDAYDGITANASSSVAGASDGGRFTRIGTAIPDAGEGQLIDYTITVDHYADRWVPTIGMARTVDLTGPRGSELTQQFFYNRATGSAVLLDPLTTGDSYQVSAVLGRQPSRSELRTASSSSLDLPPMNAVPDELSALARDWTAQAGTDGEAAIILEEQLRRGYYSHGLANDVPSLAGHGAYRMTRLLMDHDGRLVGDEEQYAVAMALMARSLGLPARVVYGYRVADTDPSQPTPVTGDDVSAWVEIGFERFGWVEFTPTPEKSRALPEDSTNTESKPRPQVENPPPPPSRPEPLPPDNIDPLPGEDDEDLDDQDSPLEEILQVVWLVGIPLAVLAAPVLLVVGLKRRRRHRRSGQGSGSDRMAGGWAELLDRSRDLGVVADPDATRTENADLVATALGRTGSLHHLAYRADWAAFSGNLPAEGVVEQYWIDMTHSADEAARSRPWWRRWWATITPRSLVSPWKM